MVQVLRFYFFYQFFDFSYIYKEGNVCADKLANIGLTLDTFVFYDVVHVDVRAAYVHNKLRMPSYIFSFN